MIGLGNKAEAKLTETGVLKLSETLDKFADLEIFALESNLEIGHQGINALSYSIGKMYKLRILLIRCRIKDNSLNSE